MRAVIFGTGKVCQSIRHELKENIEIVAFLDNDVLKWEEALDGIPICSPNEILCLEYDLVFLASVHYTEMKVQLIELGVPGSKIWDIRHRERICRCGSARYYGELHKEKSVGKILVFSHALTSTGAQNVLFTAVKTLNRHGYSLAVVSREDGMLKDRILELGIPVIIMQDTYPENAEFLELVQWADLVFVNTLWLYYLIGGLLDLGKKVIWWIHETGALESMDKDLLREIVGNRLVSTCAVSRLVARGVTRKLGSMAEIRELRFGIPEYGKVFREESEHGKMVFALIGGIGRIKGQDIFIRAVECLGSSYREKAEFWIVGRGTLEAADLERASRYPGIKVMGEIDNRRMPELYGRIDAVICCSREEAMSVVVAEGCMNEKLVVVSDAAGIAEYLSDGENGIIFENENVSQLAGIMEWAVGHGEQVKRMGCASRHVYDEYFAMDAFEAGILDTVQNGMGCRNGKE